MGVTCFHRKLQTFEKCGNCKIDYNSDHHPNNRDCSNYFEEEIITSEDLGRYDQLNENIMERIFQE